VQALFRQCFATEEVLMVPARSALSSPLFVLLFLAVCASASGCHVVGGIFKAGLWVGIIMAVFVVALVMFIVNKARS
jgi:hypothetical protein